MTEERIEYRGSRISLKRYKSGWMALIYIENSVFADKEIPSTTKIEEKHLVIERAKAIIDKSV